MFSCSLWAGSHFAHLIERRPRAMRWFWKNIRVWSTVIVSYHLVQVIQSIFVLSINIITGIICECLKHISMWLIKLIIHSRIIRELTIRGHWFVQYALWISSLKKDRNLSAVGAMTGTHAPYTWLVHSLHSSIVFSDHLNVTIIIFHHIQIILSMQRCQPPSAVISGHSPSPVCLELIIVLLWVHMRVLPGVIISASWSPIIRIILSHSPKVLRSVSTVALPIQEYAVRIVVFLIPIPIDSKLSRLSQCSVVTAFWSAYCISGLKCRRAGNTVLHPHLFLQILL